MGKASNKKLAARTTGMNANEGTITVSFVFDGKKYDNKHQLTASEMHHMKQLCREHGDQAADQMIWKVAVRGTGMVAENIMAKAALDYIKKHYKGPMVVPEVARSLSMKEAVEGLKAAAAEEEKVMQQQTDAANSIPESTENPNA